MHNNEVSTLQSKLDSTSGNMSILREKCNKMEEYIESIKENMLRNSTDTEDFASQTEPKFKPSLVCGND